MTSNADRFKKNVLNIFFSVTFFMSGIIFARTPSFIPLVFNETDYSGPKIETIWVKIKESDRLSNIFRRPILNSKLAKSRFQCRVYWESEAYQALLFSADQTYRFKINVHENSQLTFSLFNAGTEPLKVEVYAREGPNRVDLFSIEIGQGKTDRCAVDLRRFARKTIELCFFGSGSGYGALLEPAIVIPQKNPQTVIFFVADTLRRDHLSVYGYNRQTAPFLSDLVKETLKYENAFSVSSWTFPAHVSLFSGLECSEHLNVFWGNKIRDDLYLLAELFQKNGFLTMAITDGGGVNHQLGFFKGFSSYQDKLDYKLAGQINSAERSMEQIRKKILAGRGIDLLVFLHSYQVHAPYKAPSPFNKKFDSRNELEKISPFEFLKFNEQRFLPLEEDIRQRMIDLYDSGIFYLDQKLLKPLVELLKEEDRWEDTLFVLLSDHGEEFYDHQSWEHFWTLYDEVVRIPLVVKFPKRNRRVGTEKETISIKDVWKIAYKNFSLEDGDGYWKNLFDKKRDYLELALPFTFRKCVEAPRRVSFIQGNYRVIFNLLGNYQPEFFKNPPYFKPVELYRLDDIGNRKEIADLYPDIVGNFKRYLVNYQRRLKELKINDSALEKDLLDQLKTLGYFID